MLVTCHAALFENAQELKWHQCFAFVGVTHSQMKTVVGQMLPSMVSAMNAPWFYLSAVQDDKL